MKRPAGASYARFRKLARRRAEGLMPTDAPRIALVWPAASGATCRALQRKAAGLPPPTGLAPRAMSGIVCLFGPAPVQRAAKYFPKLSLHRRPSSRIVLSHGGVAQLGERLTGSQEVRGSIPLVSTRSLNEAPTQVGAFFHIYRFRSCVDWVASWRHAHC